jgi:uncharacterized protein YhaN
LRIARLDLAAFGPFTDRSLDLTGGAPGGLHVIYGRNAAGKSSALRAISDLLFGIPPKSGDDHVHPYQALRIRALLESTSGERLTIQRLKRNKDSLRDEHDAPLDDMALRRLLGNVDRAMFERVFGLDHERLRDAGLALLEGGGDVGESLFDAGAGGQGVRRVLGRLREEAERLFKPRGGKQEIVQLLEGYKAARERVRNATHAPEAYAEQQAELERHRVESERLGRELSALREERERNRLLSNALKGIAKREKLLAELAELGELPDLDPEFGARRERVQTSLVKHQANIARAEREMERLEQRKRELRPPEALLAVGEETITLLREGIGSTKKALADLPSREATLAERRADAQAGERRLGLDPARLTPEVLRARRPEEARFRKLLAERAALAERRRAAEERLEQAEMDCETQKAHLRALPPPSNADALERAVLFARHNGDVEATLAQVRRERSELDLAARAELAMLAPFDGTLAELCTLRVPARETVLHFEQRFAENEQKKRRAAEGLSACRERAAELARELRAEEQSGAVPSEQELERARAGRDERFDELCKQWPEKPGKALSLFEAARVREYRAAVSAADALADRLRREAARVAENARRVAELGQRKEEQARFADLEAALDRERAELEAVWASSWASAGFEPVRPTEMRGWLERRDRAVARVIQEAALNEREGELARKVQELRAALTEALGVLRADMPLAVGVARAEEALGRERKLDAERAALGTRIAELEVRRAAARRELERSDRESIAQEAELRKVIGVLGFEAGILPEEVEMRLEALGDWVRAREQTSELERRVNGMRRDLAAFEAEVHALVSANAPELAGLSAQRAAAELVARFDRGRRDAEALETLERELAERRMELEEEGALLLQATSAAERLLAAAHAPSLAELPAIEARTRKARELRAELDGLEVTLGETAGARGLPALLEEAAATDRARLAARLEELDGRIDQLEEQHADSIRSHQRVQHGLELFSDTSAVEAAEEERALASALVARSERWAKLKLAEVLLEREIERYREQNQGPVLRRAGELFVRLTQAEYRGLRVGREERTLVAVRANDLEVGVEGLNEAARYHLYLALRLASLERYLEHTEALPLVLDDVLIHFDEDGARAALAVLGEVAGKVQVLLFTHHRHNLTLAASVVGADALVLHEL